MIGQREYIKLQVLLICYLHNMLNECHYTYTVYIQLKTKFPKCLCDYVSKELYNKL